MNLFPARVLPDTLMEAVSAAFDAPSQRPLSRAEESRRDAFGALCDELSRDGAEMQDKCFEKWRDKHWSDENVRWFWSAAWAGDEDEMRRARDAILEDYTHDSREDETYAEPAREKLQELADEQAANEVWK